MLAAEKAQRILGPEAKNEYLTKSMQDSGLLSKEAQAEGLLAERERGLIGAKDKLEPVKEFNPNNSQSKLETAARGLDTDKEKIEVVKKLKELSQMSDVDFVKAIKDRATKNAFLGQDTNGSRKVGLFGIIGGTLGGLVGHGLVGVGSGATVGATIGALADKNGPAMAKAMLDAALKIQGSPTLAKIQALEVPPAVKAALARELADYNKAEK